MAYKKYKVFIDGQAGTTGLRLAERLGERTDIELIEIEEERRKDPKARLDCISEADLTFLCLPDEEAKAIAAAAGKCSRIIDCSTAHRTEDGWAYGMPEITDIGEESKRVANPGCHPTGFIMSIKPLVNAGIVDQEAQLCFHSLTGYSGGGKAMIAAYEGRRRPPRQYALDQDHKHLPEMQKYAGLKTTPLFAPIVCDFYCGMLVSVPLPRSALRRNASARHIHATLTEYYAKSPLVKVRDIGDEFSEANEAGFLAADAFANRDDIEIFVSGKDGMLLIVSRYDNLGKGASGAAIQNMNLMLGLPEEKGLVTGQ